MAEIGLQAAGVVAIRRELVTGGMPEHVRVHSNAQIGLDAGPFNHSAKTRRRKWRAALRHEHEGRRRALAVMLAQLPHFPAGQRMCAGRAVLDPADVQGRGLEVDLLPAQIHHFGRPVGHA